MKVNRKSGAIKDRIVTDIHSVKSRDEFEQRAKALFKDFFPDGKMDAVLDEALKHPAIKQLQSMPLEQAKEEGVSTAVKMLAENKGALTSLMSLIK